LFVFVNESAFNPVPQDGVFSGVLVHAGTSGVGQGGGGLGEKQAVFGGGNHDPPASALGCKSFEIRTGIIPKHGKLEPPLALGFSMAGGAVTPKATQKRRDVVDKVAGLLRLDLKSAEQQQHIWQQKA